MKLRLLALLLCLSMLLVVGCNNNDTSTDDSSSDFDDSDTDSVDTSDTQNSIEATITGAGDISIPRPENNGRTLSAEGYLSTGKSGEDNLAAFTELLSIVKNSYSETTPITHIDIPKGEYRIKSSKKYAIHLKELVNLIIDGNGSSFIFEDSEESISSAAFFGVENCDTIEFRNFSVDFDWDAYPLYVLGKVLSSDTTDKSVTFRIDSHKLPETIKVDGGRTWDPEIDNRSETVGFVQSGTIKAWEVLDEHTLRVTYSTPNSAQNAKEGQYFQFRFKPNFNASAFRMYYNKDITLNGITIYSAPYEAAWSVASDGYHIIDCKVVPKEGRRFTTYTGFETHAVQGNVIVENCELYGILDDNMHLSNHFMGGENVKIDDYTMELRNLQTWSTKFYFYEGATLSLYDSNYQPLGWSSVIESVTSKLEGVNDMATYTVKFRDKLPEKINHTDKFFSMDYYHGAYIIRNNSFGGGLCHALYIGLGNGTIENNTMDNFAYPSLVLTTVTRWERWHIGVGVENVVIRNNVMTRCNTALRDPASFAIVAGRDEQPSDFYPVNGYVIRNVLVENNTVDGSTGSAFALFSAENIIVKNNKFLNSNTQPTTKLRRKGRGNVYITNARNILWENNAIENAGHSYEEGLYVQSRTVFDFEEK